MSVYHQTLVVYGWEIGEESYKKWDNDDYGNELQETFGWHDKSVGDVACVYDGMGGDYCYFGVVVAAGQHIEPTNVMKVLTTRQKAELAEAKEQMGIESASGHPAFHVFTHVT